AGLRVLGCRIAAHVVAVVAHAPGAVEDQIDVEGGARQLLFVGKSVASAQPVHAGAVAVGIRGTGSTGCGREAEPNAILAVGSAWTLRVRLAHGHGCDARLGERVA